MKLEDLEIYQIALRLGDEIWDIVALDKRIKNDKSNEKL